MGALRRCEASSGEDERDRPRCRHFHPPAPRTGVAAIDRNPSSSTRQASVRTLRRRTGVEEPSRQQAAVTSPLLDRSFAAVIVGWCSSPPSRRRCAAAFVPRGGANPMVSTSWVSLLRARSDRDTCRRSDSAATPPGARRELRLIARRPCGGPRRQLSGAPRRGCPSSRPPHHAGCCRWQDGCLLFVHGANDIDVVWGSRMTMPPSLSGYATH